MLKITMKLIGILLGFSGVVESLTPSMADSAELALMRYQMM